jgi:Ca2+-dependent lipid-binding protein
LIPESVEWMNTLIAVIWGLVNPEMFNSVADTLEDVMQASLPGVFENVRVADISQGSNPFRILSMRALPDDQVKELKTSIHENNAKTKDPQEAAADEEGGEYYNMECAFAYHAAPSGAGVASKARNMHLNVVFYLGIKGLFGVPLPIWCELQGLVGTVRLRMQMTPEPPFLKTLTFTLMGIPQVSVGCIPMFKTGVNILNLPLISTFVNYAVGAACSMYVAPKSMTLDMGKMLQGDDVQKETEALGVILVKIHRATGLSKQDKRGSKDGGSDPYITLSFSKYGKPMYCTRVIQDDLNPIWEEHAGILLKSDYIRADEQLSVELWDSDRMSADDVVGKVELSLQEMLKYPGKMFPQESKLHGVKADSEMPGKLFWEVGYFEKPHFRKSLRTSGKNVNVADHLQDDAQFQDDKGVIENEEEDAVTHTPPDPLWPSGIVSIVVHQIVSLELDNISGSEGNRKGKEYEPGKEADEVNEEESKKLPSSYCTIHINDSLVCENCMLKDRPS